MVYSIIKKLLRNGCFFGKMKDGGFKRNHHLSFLDQEGIRKRNMDKKSRIMAVLGIVSILLTGCSLDSCSAEDVVDGIKEAVDESIDDIKSGAEDIISDTQDRIGIKIFDVPELSTKKIVLDVDDSEDLRFENPKYGSSVKWEIANEKIAKFKKTGEYGIKIVALKRGRTVVKAIVKRKKYKKEYVCNVIVEEPKMKYSSLFNLKTDGFCFPNSRISFGYPDPYRIPYRIYKDTFSDVFPKSMFMENSREWHGSCYGMSICSIMIQNKSIDASDYIQNGCINTHGYTSVKKNDGRNYYYLDPKSDLGTIIEKYHIAQGCVELTAVQYDPSIEYGYRRNRGKLYRQMIEDLTKNNMPYMLIVDFDYDGGYYGHALVVDPSRGVKELKDGWHRLFLYDPNYPYVKNAQFKNVKTKNKEAVGRYIEVNTNSGHWRMTINNTIKCGDEKNKKNVEKDYMYFFKTDYVINLTMQKCHLFDESSSDKYIELEIESDDCEIRNDLSEIIFQKKNGKIVKKEEGVGFLPFVDGGSRRNTNRVVLPNAIYKFSSSDKGYISFKTNTNYERIESSGGMIVSNIDKQTINVKSIKKESTIGVIASQGDGMTTSTVETEMKTGEEGSNICMSEDSVSIVSDIGQSIDLKMENDESGEFVKPNIDVGMEETSVDISKGMKKIKRVKLVKKGKNKIIITWKVDDGSKGYEVLYSTLKSFSGGNSKSTNKSKMVLRKLKKNTYYVKVRGWQQDGTGRKYGIWSKVKKIRI